jgi:hypothetical protein
LKNGSIIGADAREIMPASLQMSIQASLRQASLPAILVGCRAATRTEEYLGNSLISTELLLLELQLPLPSCHSSPTTFLALVLVVLSLSCSSLQKNIVRQKVRQQK